MIKNKKIIITGGQGYVGSVLIPYLQNSGFECAVFDTGFFKDCLVTAQKEPWITAKDARDINADDLRGCGAVVHLAGISNDPVGSLSPAKVYDPTRAYAKKIASFCKELGIPFVFASSCSIYGKATQDVVDETSTPNPQTGYSVNKLQVEEDLAELAGGTFSPIALRFATAYGFSPRLRLDLYINMMVAMAMTKGELILNSDGQAWRPNIHVEDMCLAIKLAIENPKSDGKVHVLNVGENEENYKIIDIAERIIAQIPGSKISFLNARADSSADLELIRDRKVKHAAADTRSYKVNFDKIKKELPGFKCQWSAERGIKQMINALKEMNFSSEDFKNINYYRLQKMEALWNSGAISDEFRWK